MNFSLFRIFTAGIMPPQMSYRRIWSLCKINWATSFWKGWGMMQQGCSMTLTGNASDAVKTITVRRRVDAINANDDVDAAFLIIFGEG